MIDHRLYRLAFMPALLAVVVILFSLDPVPEPLEAPVSLGAFDSEAAADTAIEIAERWPEREPGSGGDAESAELVAARFGEIATAEVAEQSFSSRFEGREIEARNVIATLPGESQRVVVVIAGRDSPQGPGAGTSAAATGVLVELAENFGVAAHRKTLVFVSTAGSTDGATGARQFADNYPERDAIDAVLVVSQPGAPEPRQPFVVPWSSGRQSTAIQLTITAAEMVSAELGRPAGLEGPLGDLLRLALPTGLGEQAPLIEEGFDAVAISSAGERPLPPHEEGPGSPSTDTLAAMGQAAQSLVLALDSAPGELEHGPSTYVRAGDNLVPGWTIAILSLALLCPAIVAALDGGARALRRGRARARDLGWVLGRSLPFVAVVVGVVVLAAVGILPGPRFPYDPERFSVGWRTAIVLVLLGVAFVATWHAARPLSVPRGRDPETLAIAAGAVASAVALVVWLLNPFLVLLAVPAAHAWIAATAGDPRTRLGATAAALVIAVLPLIASLAWLSDRLEVGAGLAWHLALMLGGGQLGVGSALLWSLLAGSLVAALAVAAAAWDERSARRPSPPTGGGGWTDLGGQIANDSPLGADELGESTRRG